MNKYQKYCTGCGLCKALGKNELSKDGKGFYYPNSKNNFLKTICPISGAHSKYLDKNNIWGKNLNVYLGWSNNSKIRNRASSGGIITEVACFLLNTNKVDAVIQVGVDSSEPTKTNVYFSKSAEEIVSYCGSRYCISSPLSVLGNLEKNKKYAFIGKPCDIVALRNYMKMYPKYKDKIPYLLSFFCMGLPSEIAQKKLLEKLNCKNCKILSYRGNGWPGFTTAIDITGNSYQITYNDSWGKILGRDLMPSCKLCVDGIGEMADVSCGDAWYLNNENRPDFSEHEGRNVVFARTEKGNKLLNEMKEAGIVTLNYYKEYQKELPLIQTSQWNRRREMKYRIIAMKLCLRDFPSYDSKLLSSYASSLSIKQRIKIIFGTCKRIINGKM